MVIISVMVQADERARREDPMMWGLNVDEPGSFNEYMKVFLFKFVIAIFNLSNIEMKH